MDFWKGINKKREVSSARYLVSFLQAALGIKGEKRELYITWKKKQTQTNISVSRKVKPTGKYN